MTDDYTPAFPLGRDYGLPGAHLCVSEPKVTLRDHLAFTAPFEKLPRIPSMITADARLRYQWADAMLSERARAGSKDEAGK